MTADIHTLAAAYATNALPPDERADFEAHLDGCDACSQEVAELQETVARLSLAVAQNPPAELRARVLTEVGRVRQLPSQLPVAPPLSGSARPGWLRGVMATAAAVVVILAFSLGFLTVQLRDRLTEARATEQRIAAVLSAEDVLTRSAPMSGGGQATLAVSPSRDAAVLLGSGIPAPPDGRTYQMWLTGPEGQTSAGLLEPDADGHVTRIASGELADVRQVAVTVEPAGGSPQPTSEPVWVARL